MSLFSIAFAYLRSKWSHSLLHIMLMALGMMLMTSLLLMGHQLEQRLYRDASGIDLVVGAKGSPLQLILSSVQHIDIPTGNILLKEARKIQKHPHIKKAIPISLGDSYRGYRIVGTEPEYIEHFKAEMAQGKVWQDSMQAVIGYQAALATGLNIGDSFAGSHGLIEGGHVHDDHSYQVTGILEKTGTVLDRLIITSLESVWDLHKEPSNDENSNKNYKKDNHNHEEQNHDHGHGHNHHHDNEHKHSHDDEEQKHEEHEHTESRHKKHKYDEENEITALLVTYRNRSAVLSFPRLVNQQTSMQAASPAFEMARLVELIGFGSNTVFLFGVMLVVISLLSVFISLLSSIRERRYDLAVFRTLGASNLVLFRLVLIEGFIITIIGSLIGLIAGHAIIEIIAVYSEKGKEMALTGWIFLPSLFWLWLGVMIAAMLACIIPAWQASRAEIHSLLGTNSK